MYHGSGTQDFRYCTLLAKDCDSCYDLKFEGEEGYVTSSGNGADDDTAFRGTVSRGICVVEYCT